MATQQQTTLAEVDTSALDAEFFDQEGYDQGELDERTGAAYPHFFWMNKRPDADTGEEIHSGWHAKTNIHPDFDTAMERVEAAGNAERVKVLHTDTEGNDVIQEYWHLTKGARVFILSRGIPPAWKMNKHPEQNVGVVYGWPFDKSKGKNVSNVKFQALLLSLVKAGYDLPVTFGCKATETINLLKCLEAHQRVIDAANTLLKSKGKPATIAYRHIALDLLQADKIDWRKSKANPNEKKACYAVVTNIPKPADPISDQFVISRHCGKELRDLIDAMLKDAEEWSKMQGVLWRDGNVEDNNQQNGARREKPEDFDPGDFGEPEDVVSESLGLASQDQRTTLKDFAVKYRTFGRQVEHDHLMRLVNNAQLSEDEANTFIQQASREIFQLQKGAAAKQPATANKK